MGLSNVIELRTPSDVTTWHTVFSYIVPVSNITPEVQKKLDERERLLDIIEAESEKEKLWVKINNGIFRGSIFQASTDHSVEGWTSTLEVEDIQNAMAQSKQSIHSWTQGADPNYQWQFTKRAAKVWHNRACGPLKIAAGTIYTEYLGAEVSNGASILIGYQGDEVFCLNEKKRPRTFKDRLDQDVGPGDLVVVALNYGAGLDVCMIKGYSDERRVVIESVDTGELDRIPLENNATVKIMKMPNSLKDTALLMKLAR
jgi:hypothetical protein